MGTLLFGRTVLRRLLCSPTRIIFTTFLSSTSSQRFFSNFIVCNILMSMTLLPFVWWCLILRHALSEYVDYFIVHEHVFIENIVDVYEFAERFHSILLMHVCILVLCEMKLTEPTRSRELDIKGINRPGQGRWFHRRPALSTRLNQNLRNNSSSTKNKGKSMVSSTYGFIYFGNNKLFPLFPNLKTNQIIREDW